MTDVQRLPSSDQARSDVQRQLPSSDSAAPDQDLDEFLGAGTQPAWLRYGKWLALALGVAALGWVLWHFLSQGGGATYATAAVGRGDLRTTVSATGIRSPVSGVVLARQIDPGQTVASAFNTPTLFVIAEDLSKMKLTVSIDEADVAAVKEGQKATFTVDAFPGRTFPATISLVEIGSNLSAQTSSGSTSSTLSTASQVVSYAADLAVDNPSLELRPGMTATADIVTSDKKDVILVPNAALRFSPAQPGARPSGGGITNALTPRLRGGSASPRTAVMGRGAAQTVYVLGDDGKPQAVRITTGDSDGSQTEVLSGDLQPGMKVITGELQAGGARAR